VTKTAKELSIIIPAYNMQDYLGRCLDSLVPVIDRLDVIIVNDGSVDDTAKVAEKYLKKYPKSITVINKENGGHGSTINAGVKVAKGKYLRVLDADDWFLATDIENYLKDLANEPADLVVTEYSRGDLEKTERIKLDYFEYGKPLRPNKIQELTPKEQIEFLAIHSITIKTENFRHQAELLENTFYEDQEFVAKAILAADNFITLPYNIYQYFIGRDGQSVSPEKQFKHRNEHARVITRLVELYTSCSDKTKKEILAARIKEIYKTHYWIYNYNNESTSKDRRECKEFCRATKKQFEKLDSEVTTGFRIRLYIGRIKNRLKGKK
jgi:glycosyltransferase involved in cell wall biosynthesis